MLQYEYGDLQFQQLIITNNTEKATEVTFKAQESRSRRRLSAQKVYPLLKKHFYAAQLSEGEKPAGDERTGAGKYKYAKT